MPNKAKRRVGNTLRPKPAIEVDIPGISRYTAPGDALGFLLNQLSRLWLRRLNANLAAIELTYLQFVLLLGLAWNTRSGGGITQKALGGFCKTSRALTSQVLRTLERKALIAQTVDPSDTRARLVGLTAKGKAKVLKALPILDRAEDEFLAGDPALKHRVEDVLRAALLLELEQPASNGEADDVEEEVGAE
jgi:DNA-binding MarR family transcriptional regulator